MPLIWIVFSAASVILFFNYLSKLLKKWEPYNERAFRKKLFKQAFIIRAVIVVFLYIFFQLRYGRPFEYDAADALFYYVVGRDLANLMLMGDFNFGKHLWMLDFSDRGFPIIQGIIFIFVFQSILLSRIVNALFGAWSCVLIYDLAKRNFGEHVGRISAILMMLLPNFLYYAGLSLKETIMIFCVVAFVNQADKVLRLRKVEYKNMLLLALAGTMLFFFRTALGLSMILSLLASVIFMSNRVSRRSKRVFVGFWVAIGFVAILSTSIGNTISQLIEEKATNQESQMQNYATRKEGNSLAKYGSMSVFLPMILVAPFPTFVNTNQENQMMLSGAYFIRNIYAFFVILALIQLYKSKQLRNHAVVILSFAFYLLILASSGFALSERFHLPIVPFLLVTAAYGISRVNGKNIKYITPYIVFICLVIIGWNWFKMTGRGM